MVSILILTRNEEVNIDACLRTVAWSDDIVVLDSLSTDRTVELARQHPQVRVIERAFDNWAAHQNWAMENITFAHPWVFYLDADERMTPELRAEIEAIANDPREQRVAFYCGRRNIFMGRWIRRAMPPGAIMRFFRPERIRFERLVNPVPVIDGPHGYLQNLFEHYNFSKGLAEWFTKHNNYSQFEAHEAVKVLEGAGGPRPRLWGGDISDRRRALKALSWHLPARPVLRFFYNYILKRGFLDGLPGFHYCVMVSIYEYWIDLKTRELRQPWAARNEALVRQLLQEAP
jgi:glycosyltransferase involved in cell wall biosynthesis